MKPGLSLTNTLFLILVLTLLTELASANEVSLQFQQLTNQRDSRSNYRGLVLGGRYTSENVTLIPRFETLLAHTEAIDRPRSNSVYGELGIQSPLTKEQWFVQGNIGGGNNSSLRPDRNFSGDLTKIILQGTTYYTLGATRSEWNPRPQDNDPTAPSTISRAYRMGVAYHFNPGSMLNLQYQLLEQLQPQFSEEQKGASALVSFTFSPGEKKSLSVGLSQACLAKSWTCKESNRSWYSEQFVDGRLQVNKDFGLTGRMASISGMLGESPSGFHVIVGAYSSIF
ncbi:MAG: hypothetical protein RJB66_1768 [Pseudomonadota bacterium]|jgi:hypothetical protein